MFDYLIVGQGIAGSVLSWQLLKAGKSVLVINNRHTNQASQVAAGVYNPITGRNLVKTWLADRLFFTLVRFYQEIESALSIKFLYPKSIFRPFISYEEKALWETKFLENSDNSFYKFVDTNYRNEYVINQYGGFVIQDAGYVDVPCFLAAIRTYLNSKGCYMEADFNYNKLSITADGVAYQGIRPTRIIFCEGPQAIQNPFFNYLPFLLVKGELLTIQLTTPLDMMYNRGVYVVPKSKLQALIGGTYNWDDLTLVPTERAKQELQIKTQRLLRIPYQILKQQAGIRPATFDRRPWIGLHPAYPQLGIFNGLGSKGVSLAPYLAVEFVEHLLYNQELPTEARLDRVK